MEIDPTPSIQTRYSTQQVMDFLCDDGNTAMTRQWNCCSVDILDTEAKQRVGSMISKHEKKIQNIVVSSFGGNGGKVGCG